MQGFFKSKKFIALSLIVVLSLFFMLRAAYTETAVPFLSKITSIVTVPVQRVISGAAGAVHETFYDFIHASDISKENEALKEENAKLLQSLAELTKYKNENSSMKEFLGVKEDNPDFIMEPARVIGRDAEDRFYSFTIDKGENHGIKKNSPVITSKGLVGLVTAVGPNFAKVGTILDTTIEVGVSVMQTREIGITEGNSLLAVDGKLRLSYLPRESTIKKGDLVLTTGIGGIFPRDIMVGLVEEASPDSQGLS
ncbi:MAG: rod shape-determining protein MreC, partial [Oscillospiraceae bacterium]